MTMLGFLKRRWMEAQALSVLQTFFDLQLKNPLPTFEAGILRAATDQTIRDRGTPHDAAARFYASYAEEAARNGSDLSEIKFGNVLSRLLTLKQEMLFFDERSEEHTSELQSLMRISYAVFCLTKQKSLMTY